MLFLLLISLFGLVTGDTFFWKSYSMKIRNVGAYRASEGLMACAGRGWRWLPVMDAEANEVVQKFMLDNGIGEAWLGLIQDIDGNRQWMATREVINNPSYQNWAYGQPQRGYAYMIAATGQWKSELTSETKTTLCVEVARACTARDGSQMANGETSTVSCETCTCTYGFLSCQPEPNCGSENTQGCLYKGNLVPVGQSIDVGCQSCTCESAGSGLQCTSCEMIDGTTGTQHETQYRLREECPPSYLDLGYRWVRCSEEGADGCERTCEEAYDTCNRRCTDMCRCPPEKPFLFHGVCKPECPGRRFSPVIVQGLSSQQFPEGGTFNVTCSAIGEPVPEIKITDATEFQPDLKMSPKKGQLGLRTAVRTYRISAGVTPSQINCYAWNVNGVAESSGNFKVIPSTDTSINPSIAADGNIRMPPLVRLGIESLAMGAKYAQRMRCVVTGAPRPEVIIVRLSGSNTFPPVMSNAQQGIHNVVAEEIVQINGPGDTGRFACLASNKYGAVKEIATLSYVEDAPGPTSANMAMTAARFRKDPIQITNWPMAASRQVCEYNGEVYEDGEEFSEECNQCICSKTRVTCSQDVCTQQQCTDSDGNVYEQFQQWKVDCNICTCLKDGTHFCTNRNCGPTGCEFEGRTVQVGSLVRVECNKCVCLSNGNLRCSNKICMEEESEPEPEPEVQCTWYDGEVYTAGEQFAMGCQTCTCLPTGGIVCSRAGCATGCDYEGRTIPTGFQFENNCQTCTCGDDGEVTCEGAPCARTSGCLYDGQTYDLFSRFTVDCNMCICLRSGKVTCTKNKCFEPKRECFFQQGTQVLPHGTQKQVECNLCTCNDGTMTCTERECVVQNKNIEGCGLEGEQRKYHLGSVLQLGRKVCKCEVTARTRLRTRILEFVCRDP